jgi:hypothetical protein
VRELQLRHLLDLATSDLEDAHEELTQIFKWKFEHSITGAKATAAAGASLIVALVVAQFQAKVQVSGVLLTSGFVGAVLVMLFGILQYYRVRMMYQQYVAAHFLLSEITKMKPFLQRYTSRKLTYWTMGLVRGYSLGLDRGRNRE